MTNYNHQYTLYHWSITVQSLVICILGRNFFIHSKLLLQTSASRSVAAETADLFNLFEIDVTDYKGFQAFFWRVQEWGV